MKRIMALLPGLFLVIGLNAQTKNHVTGTILSPDKKPFAAATVELLRAADSSKVKLALTNQEGKFSFTIREMPVTLVFSCIGYRTQETTINSTATVSIVLAEQIIPGQEIVVSASRTKEGLLTSPVSMIALRRSINVVLIRALYHIAM